MTTDHVTIGDTKIEVIESPLMGESDFAVVSQSQIDDLWETELAQYLGEEE